MPASIVVGGQFGSEGKGKVAQFLARTLAAEAVVRVGGPNSGHTSLDGSPRVVLRQLPTAAILPDVVCVIGPGSFVDPSVLIEELRITSLAPHRLMIDPHAVVIEEADRIEERSLQFRERLGSTLTGVGAALRRRIMRDQRIRFAADHDSLRPFVSDTSEYLRRVLVNRERIIIEGTQGFGLSNLHGSYPFVTSRDTTAAAFASEAGISPLDVDDVTMVIRTYPIRVSENSGPLPGEITWQDVTREAGSPVPLLEYTSVTKRVRRVGRFDAAIVRRAITVNRPTRLVVNHADYYDYAASTKGMLTQRLLSGLEGIEEKIGVRADYVGIGPELLVERKSGVLVTTSKMAG